MSENTRESYHLADGWVLAVSQGAHQLVDVTTQDIDEILIDDFAEAEAVEAVALGRIEEVPEDLLQQGLAEGVLAKGEAHADPVLMENLRRLDQYYLSHEAEGMSERAQQAYEKTLRAHAWRKRFLTAVGQCPALPETSVRRALHIGDAAEVGQKNIVCIGDDDLVSVALAALGHRVTVLDIDDYLLSFLEHVGKELELDIELLEVDLRDPLEEELAGRFDVFLTDPMSNRDCFELFLSRAFALLRPGGEGYVAVFAPTARLFRDVANEMQFDIEAWWTRHNRYYSHYMQLHRYESDWLKVRPREAVVLKPEPDDYCAALNLYREEFFDPPPVAYMLLDQIEDPHHTKPLFLDVLLDTLEQTGDEPFSDRAIFAGDDWTLAHVRTAEGFLSLHADRRTLQLVTAITPLRLSIESRLRDMLLSLFKSNAVGTRVRAGPSVWDLRVR